jgi:DNA topoisomerase I
VVVKSGRYGPYVSHDGVNATLPRDKAPETITLEEALPLLAARAEQIASGGGRRPTRGKTAKSSVQATPPDKPAKEKAAKPLAPKLEAPKTTKSGAGKSATPIKTPAASARPTATSARPMAKEPAKQAAKKSTAPKASAKRAKSGK